MCLKKKDRIEWLRKCSEIHTVATVKYKCEDVLKKEKSK